MVLVITRLLINRSGCVQGCKDLYIVHHDLLLRFGQTGGNPEGSCAGDPTQDILALLSCIHNAFYALTHYDGFKVSIHTTHDMQHEYNLYNVHSA